MDLNALLVGLVLAVLSGLVRGEHRASSLEPGRVVVAVTHWRAALQAFWNQQLRLQQLYLSSFDVSGGDALDALAQRR